MPDTILVEITYSKDKWEIGDIRELPRDQAQLLIREGRAKRHHGPIPDDNLPTGRTVIPPAQTSRARQSDTSETPAPAARPAKTAGTRRDTTPPAGV